MIFFNSEFFFVRNKERKAKRTCGKSVGKKTRLDKGEVRGGGICGGVQRRFRGWVATSGASANTARVLVVMVMPGRFGGSNLTLWGSEGGGGEEVRIAADRGHR